MTPTLLPDGDTVVLSGRFVEMASRIREMLTALPQNHGDHEHTFTPGPPGYVQWAHRMILKSGTMVETIRHKFHSVYVMTGTMLVWDSRSEEEPHWIIGPSQGESTPGTKRIMMCMTDVVWTRVLCVPEHLNNKPDEALDYITCQE